MKRKMRERRTDREQIADSGTHNTFIYERGGKIIYVQTIFAKIFTDRESTQFSPVSS